MANMVHLSKFIVLLSLVSFSAACPPALDIAPCVCSQDSLDQYIMECYGIESETQLEAIFQSDFPDKSFYNLYLDLSPNLVAIGDVFNGVTFEVVELYRSGIQSIAPEALMASVQTLERLIVKSTPITTASFPFSSFESFSKLSVLDILDSNVDSLPPLISNTIEQFSAVTSNIRTIRASTFQGLSSLTGINLERNKLNLLETGTFSSIPTLRSINLSENDLIDLPAGSFEFNNVGTNLYIWNNNLTTITPGAFVLPQSTDSFSMFLDVGSNQLQILDESVFAELFPYMDFLFAAGNPLICGCDIAWLVTNQDWIGKVGNTAECVDGTRLVDLDPEYFELSC